MAYALIVGGVIRQKANATFPVAPSMVWADLTGILPVADVGWTATVAAGVWSFTAPIPPVPPILPPQTQMSPLTFVARFTQAEITAIATAAMGNVQLWLWFQMLTAATYIDLTDQQTITGTAALVTAGLLTSARATAILTP